VVLMHNYINICIASYTVSHNDYHLPEVIVCLTFVLNEVSSLTSVASPGEDLHLILVLEFGNFKPSLEGWIEFTILSLNTGGSWVVVLPPFQEIWKDFMTTSTTAVTKDNYDCTCNHSCTW